MHTALFWEYDTRIARRWNLDPVDQVRISNYASFGNNPITNVDPLGDMWYANDLGYYIWSNSPDIMSKGFRHLIGNQLPDGVVGTQILMEKEGYFFYKNRRSLVGRLVNFICNDCDENMELVQWTPHDAMMGEELRDYAVIAMAGKLAKPVLQLLKRGGGSIWRLASWTERGFVYEAMRGGNLVRNYPVIDKFINGVATSIKTMNLGDKTYKNPKAIYSTLKGYIDKLAKFPGANKGGVNTIGKIESRVLDVGIPKGATADQAKALEQIIQYGKQQNVEVIINTVK